MIKFGTARLYLNEDYGDDTYSIIDKQLDVVEKTTGGYIEVLVNNKRTLRDAGYGEIIETNDKWDVYVGITAEQAVLKYRDASEALSWLTPLTEV